MNKRNVYVGMVVWLTLALLGAQLLAGCSPRPRVGALQTESKSVELAGDKPVRVEVNFGAGNLTLAGGAEKLLEADFTYNVAVLKPEVKYRGGTLVVRQPATRGLPSLRNITDFRNEWNLLLSDQVPMDLYVDMGAGSGDLKLAGLPLTGLEVNLGGGETTIDLSGNWAHDLDVTIDTGASITTVRLPDNVGVRVEVESGPHTIYAPDLSKDGAMYTNAAYGESEVTLHVSLNAGIGHINMEVAHAVTTSSR